MEVPCLYCHESGKFRHDRPDVSDETWLKMIGRGMACPLCKGKGKVDRPIDGLVLDTGLLFVHTKERRVVVACPDPICTKWVDCTDFFAKKESMIFQCPIGHPVELCVEPKR